MSLTEHLIAARKRAALSQGEVAEALGVSRQAVSRWENGLALPSTDNLARLSRLYGISIDMLLDYRSDPTVDFTLQIGVERKFTGPPEFPNNPNNYNSREYRVKFFGDSYKWTQTRNDSRGYVLGTRTGTFEVPTYYLEYCIDHSV